VFNDTFSTNKLYRAHRSRHTAQQRNQTILFSQASSERDLPNPNPKHNLNPNPKTDPNPNPKVAEMYAVEGPQYPT